LLPFAHVTYPKIHKSKRGGHFALDLLLQDNPSTSYFTCLTAILSTNVATSIFNSDKFPLVKKLSYAAFNSRPVMMKNEGSTVEYVLKNTKPFNQIARKIYFIELTPFREKITYPSIEQRKLLKNNNSSDCIIIYD
jgi:hypothetical protein